MLTSAVIVAAGRGTRMQMDVNKQYVEIGGIPVLARTLMTFEQCSLIDEIIVVVNEQDMLYCKENIIDYYDFSKTSVMVSGGATRQESVYKGLLEVRKDCSIAVIHDGARPFVENRTICDSIRAASEFGSCCAAVPAKDTIKVSDPEGFIKKTLERSSLWSVQTPQTFRYPLIMEAHKKAREEGFAGTDDAVLVERLGLPLKLVMGSYYNIKITTSEDLTLAEAIAGVRDT